MAGAKHTESAISVVNVLTGSDSGALRAAADLLCDARQDIASEISARVAQMLPDELDPQRISHDDFTALNSELLGLIFERARAEDLPGLYRDYYAATRRVLQHDLQRAPAQRVSVTGLYAAASAGASIVERRLGSENAPLWLAYMKLTTQLTMLISQAYSDCREDYLQSALEQINTLSHELGAPLSHLCGNLEMLRDGDFGALSGDQRTVVDQLIHEADDLLWLLTGTLNLYRLDTGRVNVFVEEFRLSAVFTEVVNNLPRLDTPVTWSVPLELPPMRSDRVKVKQIVNNLVRNALRHGERSPVSISAAVITPSRFEVTVRDQGPGIKSENLRMIFNFLERGEAEGLARDGYGIGLHVVRRLTQLLGGTIEVDSAPGQGACFRLRIPSREA